MELETENTFKSIRDNPLFSVQQGRKQGMEFCLLKKIRHPISFIPSIWKCLTNRKEDGKAFLR